MILWGENVMLFFVWLHGCMQHSSISIPSLSWSRKRKNVINTNRQFFVIFVVLMAGLLPGTVLILDLFVSVMIFLFVEIPCFCSCVKGSLVSVIMQSTYTVHLCSLLCRCKFYGGRAIAQCTHHCSRLHSTLFLNLFESFHQNFIGWGRILGYSSKQASLTTLLSSFLVFSHIILLVWCLKSITHKQLPPDYLV